MVTMQKEVAVTKVDGGKGRTSEDPTNPITDSVYSWKGYVTTNSIQLGKKYLLSFCLVTVNLQTDIRNKIHPSPAFLKVSKL